MIYLDNAATTPMSAVAISAMTKVMQETHGNPSSIHGHGRQAGKLLREARQELAQLLGTKPQHIFFTSGGTEGNNTAIIGYCLRHQEQGKHIITTAIEHHAVLETIDYLVQNFGFEVTIIQPENQEITAQQIQESLRDDTILVSTMFANNETGNLLPIAEIGQILKQHPAVYHVDAVQAIGKIPIHPEELGIDFLTASAHKFHGLRESAFSTHLAWTLIPISMAGTKNRKNVQGLKSCCHRRHACGPKRRPRKARRQFSTCTKSRNCLSGRARGSSVLPE